MAVTESPVKSPWSTAWSVSKNQARSSVEAETVSFACYRYRAKAASHASKPVGLFPIATTVQASNHANSRA